MAIDAMITAEIISMLERGVELYTIEQLRKVVSNMLGKPVSKRQIRNSLNRNRHRIKFDGRIFTLTIDF